MPTPFAPRMSRFKLLPTMTMRPKSTGSSSIAAAAALNMRGCGGTESLCSTLYHAGLTCDLRQILRVFREEGRVLSGREGLLLETASGKRYILNDAAGCRPGQRVRVTGTLVPLCVTAYDECDGCVLNYRVDPL